MSTRRSPPRLCGRRVVDQAVRDEAVPAVERHREDAALELGSAPASRSQ